MLPKLNPNHYTFCIAILNIYMLHQSIYKYHFFHHNKKPMYFPIGNPIMISVILVWRVKDTFAAAFAVTCDVLSLLRT